MILRARGGDRALRAFEMPSMSRVAAAAYGGVAVTGDAAAGLPAFDEAVRIASEAVASLRLAVWTGAGVDRRRVTNGWQAAFFDGTGPNPDQPSWFEFWELVESSLTARRNAYIWRTIDRGRVVALWGLHPDQVEVCGPGQYRVTMGAGGANPMGVQGVKSFEVHRDVILHIKGPGGAGRDVAPSPIETFRRTFGAAIAQEVWQEGLYTRGTGSGVILSFPRETTKNQATEAKDLWESTGAGVTNSHGTRVVSGGATVTRVGLNAEDTAFVEAVGLSVEQIARITGVPASLIGSDGGTKPISPEHELTRWQRYGLNPRLLRIEANLRADPYLFGPGAGFYPQFDNPDPVRGDRLTEDQIIHQKVQDGRLLIDEARALEGRPPLPNGVGQIPQVVPVGGAPNPEPPPAQE